MWFLLFMISIHGKWSTFTIWRVYLWCVFFISRSSFVCAKLTAHRDMFTSCWMWCRFSVFFLFRVYFSLCIITIHQIITLRGTTVFHVILLYRFFSSSSSLVSFLLFLFFHISIKHFIFNYFNVFDRMSQSASSRGHSSKRSVSCSQRFNFRGSSTIVFLTTVTTEVLNLVGVCSV